MGSLVTMWSSTRMVALTAVCAAAYVALLVPFKGLVILPGFTEIRPAACLPIAFGILFGPAACWGSAVGNLVGDTLGMMLGPGSLFGFAGNFLLACVPWRLSRYLGLRGSLTGAQVPAPLVRYGLCVVAGSAACAIFLGWGVDLLGSAPFAVLANIIFLNNALVGLVLGPLVLEALGPRLERWGLDTALAEERRPNRPLQLAGLVLLLVGTLGAYVTLNIAATGAFDPLAQLHASNRHPLGAAPVTWGGAAAVVLMLLGLALL